MVMEVNYLIDFCNLIYQFPGWRAVPGAVAEGRQLLRGDGERDHHRRRRPGQVPTQRPVGGHLARATQDLQARNQVCNRMEKWKVVQGDQAACPKPPVDTNAKVAF